MPRVLLLLPVASYRNQDFLDTAQRLGIEVVCAADHCHQLAAQQGLTPILSLHFDQPEAAAEQVLTALGRRIDAVLAVDDAGGELAAILRDRLNLPGNTLAAVRVSRDKLAFRQLLLKTGLNCPAFYHHHNAIDTRLPYPAVVKPRRLSASRGVMRADTDAEFNCAIQQAQQIQQRDDRDAAHLGLLVEAFIPGAEYALEGLLEIGQLRVLALFDKPDPLDGPYFEETIYVTPSRLAAAQQQAIQHCVATACVAMGLTHGVIHAEMRVNDRGVWLLEIAARSIGGLCGRMLRTRLGMPLEELILRHALALPIALSTDSDASGVMMIPVPLRGIYQGVDGLDAARSVPHIDAIQISARPGQRIAPAPESASYLGFIFSRAATPAQAEAALRDAHARLTFAIQPDLMLRK